MTKFKNINFIVYLFPLLITIPIIWPLFRPGFYVSHDGEWIIIRLTAFHQSLRSGQFPVRWVNRLNHQYGYPVINFAYPLGFYLAEPFYIVTKNAALAIKIVYGLSIILMSTGTYLLLKKYGKLPALIGSFVYTYSPYVLSNLHIRGSLENLGMGLVPWVFWFLSRGNWIGSSILIAALITSHNIVVLLFLPIIFIYSLINVLRNKKKRGLMFKKYLLIYLLSFSLSASYWLPAFSEYHLIRASRYPTSDFQNGYLNYQNALRLIGIPIALTTFGIPLYFSTVSSAGLWNKLSFLQSLQFSWRVMSVFCFLSSIITAYVLFRIKPVPVKIALSLILILLVFYSAYPFLKPPVVLQRPAFFYETNDATGDVRAEFTPLWVINLPDRMPDSPQIHYYPGLKIFANDKYIPNQNPNLSEGLLIPCQQILPSEKVRIIWSETPVRLAANIISVVSALYLLYWYKKPRNGIINT